MLSIVNKAKCTGCHACATVCPKSCIAMARDDEGFLYPNVDASVCINCGLCEKACPIITPAESKKTEKDIIAYAAFTKNEAVRIQSSSGGLFTEIATHIIENGGVVFGAAFDENWCVKHICVENINDLEKLRGSKYVQSTIGNTYKEAKEHLEAGETVLFTGTPCQIGGLYSYLGKKQYDNLITQDIICHGVPSAYVWQEYLKYKKADDKDIKKISFRDKRYGWNGYHYVIVYGDGSEYVKKAADDEMSKAFLRNLCLRPSCYSCAFKTKVRQSDITLADFWGVQSVIPEMYDNKGTSLVFVNSEKGKKLFENVKEHIVCSQTDIDKAITNNASMVKSVNEPMERKSFIRTVTNKGFGQASKKYLSNSLFKKIKRKFRRVLSKVFK